MWVKKIDSADSWQMDQVGEHQDGSRNYLLRVGEFVTELHIGDDNATFHRYSGVITDDANPLNGLEYLGSTERPSLAFATWDVAWQALAAFR